MWSSLRSVRLGVFRAGRKKGCRNWAKRMAATYLDGQAEGLLAGPSNRRMPTAAST
jgi:hypothetical protein